MPKRQEAKETKKPTSRTRQESYKKSSGQEAQKPKNQEAKENKKPKSRDRAHTQTQNKKDSQKQNKSQNKYASLPN